MNLAERLRGKLARPPDQPLFHSDDPRGPPADQVPAAVLIAITHRPEPGVILTVRRPDLRTHAGQIAFPGGRIDPGETPTQAALREAWEEVDLPRDAVEPIAELDEYRTITGYAVTPVLGLIPPDLPLTPHDGEVSDWFEAPLAHLLDPANQVYESVLFEGLQRHYYRIEWNGRNIWGATAAMLVNLSRRLRWA
jgi:8-oxo-dGTP pyrophosphatase MutT (NUDIX family)